jgi:polyisoprenoid-binding protein YceI
MDAEGTFGRFDGEVTVDPGRPESATGRLVVHVASLNTQNAIRDRHLRSDDFLDVSRHPTATFVTASVRRDAGRLVVDGQLTIRGTSRPVSVPVILSPDGVALRITGELVLSRRAFGVLYQSTLNPIRDEVRLVWDLIAVTR